jgi:hypothetical protein
LNVNQSERLTPNPDQLSKGEAFPQRYRQKENKKAPEGLSFEVLPDLFSDQNQSGACYQSQ